MKVILSILEFNTKSVICLENYFEEVLLDDASECPSRGLEVSRNFRGSS
jgi:hypothetical protein